MSTEPGRGIEIALGLLLAAAVFAFGSTSFWSQMGFVAATAILFTAWWFVAARSRAPEGFEPVASDRGVELGGMRFRWAGLAVPACLVIALVVLQLVPLPTAVRARLAPGATEFASSADEILMGTSASVGGWAPLSARPGDTMDALLLLIAYMLLFVMVYNLVGGRSNLLRLGLILVAIGFAAAMVGLVQDLSGADRIYGLKTLRFGGSPYGPYVNHNHFAGLMELTIPIAFGLLLRRIFRPSGGTPRFAPESVAEPPGSGSAAQRILDADVPLRGERFGQAVILGLAVVVMLTALLRSLSRGGVLSLVAASALVLVLVMIGGKLGRWEVGVLALVVGVGVVLFLWIGPSELLEHFRRAESVQNEPSLGARLKVWEASLDLFRAHPVVGAGLGAYGAAFLHFYPAGTENLWLQAHNDYIQVLAELGIVGAAVVAYGLLVFLARLLSPLISKNAVRERFVYYGLVAAILSLLIHSIVDFNLQIPANGAVFVTCCAMALSQRNSFR